jgi:hypothetical protein
VRLLDARVAGLDEPGLRAWARAENVQPGSGRCAVSRSYSYPYALVAWHDDAVGVDIERIEACDAAFADSICTPRERAELAADGCLTALWCSKEALSKALGDALEYDPRRLDSPMLWPGGRAGPWRAAPVAAPAGHTAWLCWRARAGTSP